jgi:hypothetical protein
LYPFALYNLYISNTNYNEPRFSKDNLLFKRFYSYQFQYATSRFLNIS